MKPKEANKKYNYLKASLKMSLCCSSNFFLCNVLFTFTFQFTFIFLELGLKEGYLNHSTTLISMFLRLTSDLF